MFHLPKGFLAATCGLTATAVVTLAAGFAPVQAAEVLRIGGTGSTLGGMQRLADAFRSQHPDIDLVILPSLGSGGGIKALIAGKTDLSVSARPMNAAEAAAGLVEHEYARTPLVFATHLNTAADGVTLAQVANAYRGDVASWPDGSRLRLVMRPPSEADTAFADAVSEMDEAAATPSAATTLVESTIRTMPRHWRTSAARSA
jgi:phosphate transport system substrate-binding protein